MGILACCQAVLTREHRGRSLGGAAGGMLENARAIADGCWKMAGIRLFRHRHWTVRHQARLFQRPVSRVGRQTLAPHAGVVSRPHPYLVITSDHGLVNTTDQQTCRRLRLFRCGQCPIESATGPTPAGALGQLEIKHRAHWPEKPLILGDLGDPGGSPTGAWMETDPLPKPAVR